jgi:2-polyprenyl-3-methyl-5-hydroxy-6-metoxy-1,4-benzoquinol methylase
MHENSRLAFEAEVLPLIQPGWCVMDVGAPRGNRGHREQLVARGCDYWYSDLSNKGHQKKITWLDEYRMDCDDNRFDAVVTGQTLEHVKWIWVWMKELARVTKPGGIVASISPITWAEHRYPVD